MDDTTCVVEVGLHPAPYWKDHITGMVVCSRHKQQYDESEFGPFDWQPLEKST